jgi:hypothetical protein
MQKSKPSRKTVTASLTAGIALAAVGTGFFASAAAAEARASICEFYNHGDFKRELSGPCTLDESSEEVNIKLNDGSSMRFIPERDRKGHFIDQDGNRLDVKHENDWKRVYRWKRQRLIVQISES